MFAQRKHFFEDIVLILLSVAIALLLGASGLMDAFVDFVGRTNILIMYVAGLFFTSVFTTPLAIVLLGELAMHNNIYLLAVIGGLGALSGDYVMFRFFKDRVSEDLAFLLKLSKIRRLPHLFRTTAFKWFAPFLGALVIASPLPDEIGVAILGLSKLDERTFVPISFVANSLGILVIGLIATKFFG
ncbi:MAG: hypothetical protein RLZZ347_662 [Candidatus Parcubacteria bacterium]|jgi:hypothetical protein